MRKSKQKSADSDNILSEIVEFTRSAVAQRKQLAAEELLSRRARALPPCRDFVGSLRPMSGPRVKIIAEVKKGSPSRGVIREHFHPLALARELSAAGAVALSVLTEPKYFFGSLRYLKMIADNVNLPLLRKDFIIDSYQIYEARLNGADAVLLIAAILTPHQFGELAHCARELGLAVLAEVHTEEELQWVVEFYPEMIGVNSRNLKTFNTDLSVSGGMMKQIPPPIVRVAESGIQGHADITALTAAGADAFLVGETLMRSQYPGQKLRELCGDDGQDGKD